MIYTKDRLKKGFTLMEVMMTVAIIVILIGVSFVGVTGYLRSMALLERDAVAKEIFIAAQNNLTMASGQGYLGKTDPTTKYETDDNVVYYYYMVPDDTPTDDSSVLNVMLPFGSIDETVRAGSYVIAYQKDAAIVSDVFYCPKNGRYSGTITDDYKTLYDSYAEDTNKNNRKSGSMVIGWYGGEKVDSVESSEITVPEIELCNDEVLYAKITNLEDVVKTSDDSADVKVKLIVEGVSSGAAGYFDITSSGVLVLDDITDSTRRFNQINGKCGLAEDSSYTGAFSDITFETGSPEFIPGEDIKVYAVASDNTRLTNIAKSVTRRTNSLFAKVYTDTSSLSSDDSSDATIKNTALISEMRHLENLDNESSGMLYNDTTEQEDGSIFQIQYALQNKDLYWENDDTEDLGFTNSVIAIRKKIGSNVSDVKVTYGDDYSSATKESCYLPIRSSYALKYDGNEHSISNVTVNYAGDAGLISSLQEGSRIENLAIIDSNITSTDGNAGAVAGSMADSSIVNVLAYHSSSTDSDNDADSASESTSDGNGSSESQEAVGYITASAGSAGGLVGSMTDGSVLVSAAALYVSGSANAGGLVGIITVSDSDEAKISGCYSGGHLDTSTHAYSTKSGEYNVTGGSAAGGLVGAADSAEISYSYSTCSVSGTTAGGLVGTASGTLTGCYSTGLVDGTTKGAFAGSVTGTGKATNCLYFEAVNLVSDSSSTLQTESTQTESTQTIHCLGAVGDAEFSGISAFDATLEDYRAFTANGVTTEWTEAIVYDKALSDYYDDLYNLQSISQLAETGTTTISILAGYSVATEGETDSTDYYVEKHYGDWPAPELQVENSAETEADN